MELKTLGHRLKRASTTRVDTGIKARPAAAVLPGVGSLALIGTWFGLVTGLLELGLRLGQQLRDHRVTVDAIRTNHHWIWMTPASDALLFASCGLLFGLLTRRWPRVASWLAHYTLCTLSSLALLLT